MESGAGEQSCEVSQGWNCSWDKGGSERVLHGETDERLTSCLRDDTVKRLENSVEAERPKWKIGQRSKKHLL